MFDVQRVLHDVKEREREDAAELEALLIRCPRGPLGCGYSSTGIVESATRKRGTRERYHIRIEERRWMPGIRT